MRQKGRGRSGRIYRRALEVTVEELEKTHSSLGLHNSSEIDVKYKSAQAVVRLESLVDDSNKTKSLDLVRSYQLSEKDKLLGKILSVGKELLSFFVPLSHQHCLTKKYWGAIYSIHAVSTSS